MIAGDRELKDRYLCRRISPYDRSTRGYLPVVQVLRVVALQTNSKEIPSSETRSFKEAQEWGQAGQSAL